MTQMLDSWAFMGQPSLESLGGPMRSVRPPLTQPLLDARQHASQEVSHLHSCYQELLQGTGEDSGERTGAPGPSVHPFCLCPLALKDLGWQRKAAPLSLTPTLPFPLCLRGPSSSPEIRAWLVPVCPGHGRMLRPKGQASGRGPGKGTGSENKEQLRVNRTLWKGWVSPVTCPG